MNYLILINQAPNYFYFYNQLAIELKNNGNNVYYAVNSRLPQVMYDFENTSFKTFCFSEYMQRFNSDIELSKSYYKYNLCSMFFSDYERLSIYNSFSSKINYRDIIKGLLLFFDEIISTYQIDKVIYEDISNSFAYSAFIVSQEYNKKYIGISCPRISGYFEILSGINSNRELIKENYNKIMNNKIDIPENIKIEVDKYIDNFFNSKPSYMINNQLSSEYLFIFRYISKQRFIQYYRLIKYKIKYYHDNKLNFQAPVFKLNINCFKRNLFRKLKIHIIKNYLKKTYDSNIEYYFYPIHYHPEASTSILASSYVNEFHNILNISINIPFGSVLLVKEHESSVGNQSLKFYKQISFLPNVVLLSHKLNAKEIILHSKAVITITSTVGYEAIILNKPVYVFGDVFYDFHPLCIKLKNYNELFENLSASHEISNYDPKLFLYAYLLSAYKGEIKYNKELSYDDLNVINDICKLIS